MSWQTSLIIAGATPVASAGGFSWRVSMIQRQQRQVLVESRPKPWDVHRYVLANFHKAGPLAIKRLSSSCAKIVIKSQPDGFLNSWFAHVGTV